MNDQARLPRSTQLRPRPFLGRRAAHPGARLFALAAAAWFLAAAIPAQIPNDQCTKCHAQEWIGRMSPVELSGLVRIPPNQHPILRNPDQIKGLFVPDQTFKTSAHAGLRCIDCHRGIERLPHDQRLPVAACSDCHTDVEKTIATGPHKPDPAAPRRRPACSDCHGPAHAIPPAHAPRAYDESVRIVNACSQCHNGTNGLGFNPVETYRENVHGQGVLVKGLSISATCVDCHGHHAMLPVTDAASPIAPQNVPKTCGKCHQGIAEIYFGSIHGQHLLAGDKNAASCTSCHHSHGIGPINKPFLRDIVKECSHCHEELGESYLKSYHGKATQLGEYSVAVCSSCHGAHNILPPTNPRSNVAKANLVQTCRKCHPGANRNFVKYYPHAELRNRAKNPQVFWTWLVMTTLLLSVLAVFIPHGLMWFQRTLVERVRHPRGYHGASERERMLLRFNPVHRLTHALIIISFMGLVFTGFPLKYSYAHWAQQLANMLGGIHVMGIAHRVLAIITFTYAGIHAAFLAWFFAFRCPRPRLRYLIGPDSMIFNLKDLKDAFAMLRWFLWLGPRPRFDRWTYYEKFDYWGEMWGVLIIGGTGLILWFPTLFTNWLPGWIINCAMVVHSIEALLAASVIFLVHFFNTHVRPEKFPIDMVMLTGQISESEMEEERPAEYERLKQEGTLDRKVVAPVALHWRVLGAIAGVIAFTIGVALIILALSTELRQLFR
ncbi:MAG: hypothetical protein M1457_05665 [bacterium]|nr:hypothetical protein [bacterium]